MDKLLQRRNEAEDEDFYALLGCDETSTVSTLLRFCINDGKGEVAGGCMSSIVSRAKLLSIIQ